MRRLYIPLLAVVLISSCEDHSIYLTNEPVPHQWGSFGEEIYRILLGALAAADTQPAERALAWRERRPSLIQAADMMLPPDLHDPAEAGLHELLGRVDDGTMPRLTRSTSVLLSRLATDRPTLDAVLALRDEPWCAERDEVYDLLRHATQARNARGEQIFVPLSARMLLMLRAHDGRTDQGLLTDGEPQEVRELLRAATRELEDVELGELDEAHSLDSSLVERLVAAAGLPYDAEPIWVVQADLRGLPRVASDPTTGLVYTPFMDTDGDGLADIGADGHLVHVLSDASTLDVYGDTDRHARNGQALAHNGRPLYDYVDFGRSGVGVACRGVQQMAFDNRHAELVHHVDDLLRPREVVIDERDGTYYESFPAGRTESLEPAFDLIWGLLESTRTFPPDQLLYGAEDLVRDHRADVRNLLEQALDAGDTYAETPHGETREHNSLLDDLILAREPPGAVWYGQYDDDWRFHREEPPGPLALRLIESGIMRDLVELFDDPALGGMAEAMVELMTHRDNPVRQDQTRLYNLMLSTGEARENRSVLQRLLHLVHDANGSHFSTWLTELIDWRVENLAVFYLESYCDSGPEQIPELGLWVLGDYFSDTRPTPLEIARFMVVDHDDEFGLWDNPAGREGRDLWNYNADTLLAMHVTGANDAMQPLVQVFCDHSDDHRELLLLANLFSVLHEHWSTLPEYTTDMSDRFDFYTVETPAGLRAVEPALAAAIGESDVVNQAFRVGAATTTVPVEDGVLADELIDFVHHLIDPHASVLLRVHAGEPERDLIYPFDLDRSRAPLPHPTHLNVIVQRVSESTDTWDAQDESVRENLTSIFDLLSEYYLDWPGEDAGPGNQADYLVRVAERALPELASWTRDNLDSDRWDDEIASARTEVDDLEESLTDLSRNPLLPAILDIVLLLLDDPEAGPLIREMLLYFLTPAMRGVEPGELPDPLTALARIASAAIQALPEHTTLEQLLRWAATVLDPLNSPIASAPGDLALITGGQSSSAALRAVANGLGDPVTADVDRAPALAVVAEALVEVGRENPGSDAPLTAEDLSVLARHAVQLLEDHQHGIERIYSIVGERAR